MLLHCSPALVTLSSGPKTSIQQTVTYRNGHFRSTTVTWWLQVYTFAQLRPVSDRHRLRYMSTFELLWIEPGRSEKRTKKACRYRKHQWLYNYSQTLIRWSKRQLLKDTYTIRQTCRCDVVCDDSDNVFLICSSRFAQVFVCEVWMTWLSTNGHSNLGCFFE